jgi:methionine-rich copper-binding protein CopC
MKTTLRAPVLGAVLAAGLALSSVPQIAAAHAHLKQAVPGDGSVVTVSPPSFSLSFSEAAHLTALSLQRQRQRQGQTLTAQKIAPLPREASEAFTVPAPTLDPGVYTLRYRVVAADDGHVSSGMITFTVAAPAP